MTDTIKRCKATIRVANEIIRCSLEEGHGSEAVADGDPPRYLEKMHQFLGWYMWCDGGLQGKVRVGFNDASHFIYEHEPGNRKCPCRQCEETRNLKD